MTKRTIKKPAGCDDRKEANGFKIGQRIRLVIGGETGTVIGFGPAMHNGSTVFTTLDNLPGNRGTYHACGNSWVEAI